MKNKKFHLLTYGCQMNIYDSLLIAEILRRSGYKETRNEGEYDIILVNTCSVREHAERRVIGRIGHLQKLRWENKNLIIGLVGCMAQNYIDEGKSIPGVDFMLGPADYLKLPEMIKSLDSLDGLESLVGKIKKTKNNPYKGIYPESDSKISAFVPVMRGCDNFCTYCIVPYVRVGVQMRSSKDILKEVEGLLKEGIKEIILLGQSVNQYEESGNYFPDILKLVAKRRVSRVGFLTSHPYYTTQKLIDVVAEYDNIYKWIHLPLQSGSDRILKKMNRKYTKEKYIKLIKEARRKIPEVSITTDIIVGFPGETEKDFQETINLIKAVKFDFAYMFKYSDRERTVAYKLKPKITEKLKIERLEKLVDIQNKIIYNKGKKLIGSIQNVFVEYESRKNNGWRGKTGQNKIIVFKGKASPGEIVKVKITGIKGWTPYGKLMD